MTADPINPGNFAYAALAFVVGAASGFQGVHEKYKHGSLRALGTLPGFLYVASRGAVPGAVFAGMYAGGVIGQQLWLWALACGITLESVLRTRFYLRQTGGDGAPPEEVWRGLFDLVRWYQNLCLESAAAQLADRRKRFVTALLGATPDFPALLQKARNNLLSWPDQNVQADLSAKTAKLEGEFNGELPQAATAIAQQELNTRYSHKLAFVVLDALGEKGCRTLLS